MYNILLQSHGSRGCLSTSSLRPAKEYFTELKKHVISFWKHLLQYPYGLNVDHLLINNHLHSPLHHMSFLKENRKMDVSFSLCTQSFQQLSGKKVSLMKLSNKVIKRNRKTSSQRCLGSFSISSANDNFFLILSDSC